MNAALKGDYYFSQKIGVHVDIDTGREFRSILKHKKIKVIFQPIVNLHNGEIFGYEGLTRGPKQSEFQSPIRLFEFAELHGSLYALEKIAREQAFHLGHSLIKQNEKIFININSQVIHDPDFTPGHTISLLAQYGLSPDNVVFEITERSAIQDYSAFKEVLNHYRDQGFKIAIDDAGAGYSSLQAISEIMPDYIKIDRSLISDIHENEIKVSILEAFVTFAKKMNSKIIAEGIEKIEELQKVIELGIDYGQGFYLSKPSYPVKQIPFKIIKEIQEAANQAMNKYQSTSIIVQLTDELIIMDKDKLVQKSIVNRLL